MEYRDDELRRIRRKKLSNSSNKKFQRKNETENLNSETLKKVRMRKKNRKKRYRRKILKTLLSFILIIFLTGSLFSAGYVAYALYGIPQITKEIVYSKYINKEPVSIDKIPDDLKNAIVAIEDQRFYKHNGVDIKSLLRSAINNITTDSTQGGSTIDMQVSKNLLTSQQRTMKRKIRDIYYAIQLNKIMTKDEILEAYLNNITLGNGIYGVKEGANNFFAKNVEDLNLPECAMLAGITNNPSKFDIFNAAKRRQEVILKKMFQLGYIDEQTYIKAKNQEVYFKSVID
ncbi:MAG: transglycosylase domain-containing protein [Clostridioides sp.]|nr:transglycosylase domain-containing protein [Clostridioides sp.]